MRIALFTAQTGCRETTPGNCYIFLFEVDGELITAVGDKYLQDSDCNYIVLWLLGKRIGKIYLYLPDKSLQELARRAGIEVRPLDELRNHPIFSAFIRKPCLSQI